MVLPPKEKTVQKVIYRLIPRKLKINADQPGEIVAPGDKNWPTRPVLRQLRCLANTIIEDKECEFVDIPMCLNVNIPIPFSPYGQGEPERLQGLQMAINSLVSDMITHWHMHAQPAEFIPESVNQQLPAFAQKQYTATPGTKFVVPDHIMQQLQGKIGWYMDPPKLPADGWQLLQLLLKLIDDSSDHAEVMQGKASASWSGAAIAELQKAAKGAIGLKSRRLEYMLQYLSRIIDGCIVHRMPMEEKAKYVRRYPEAVWYAIEERILNLDESISVEIASGSGAQKQAKQVSDLSLYDRKLISPQTILEASGHDPKLELSQILQWSREQQQLQQQVPAGMGSQVITPVPDQGQPSPVQAPQGQQEQQQPQQSQAA